MIGDGGMPLRDFTVFVIDDDQGVLDALSRFLRAAGYKTKAYS
jgi:FixJ family two-component response regulator